MKIAILSHSLYPLSQPYAGGLEMIVHLLVRSLQKLGHDITVYAHPDSQVDPDLIPVDVSNSSIVDAYTVSGDDLKYVVDYAFAKAVQHIASQPYDIVHNHTLNSTAYLALSHLDIPVLNTFHTPKFPYLIPAIEMLNSWENMYASTVSDCMVEHYNERIKNVEVVHNGIDIGLWKFNDQVSENYMFWCGRICKEKAPEDAIAVAMATGKKLILAGPKYDVEYFETFVAPYLDYDNISYVGHLQHQEVSNYMCNASVFLFTSKWDEPYGLVIAESLASGTPVLGYDVGAASEILNETCGILVPVGNVDALINNLEDISRVNRIACRYRAENFCDYRSMTRKYVDLYQQVLNDFKTKTCIV